MYYCRRTDLICKFPSCSVSMISPTLLLLLVFTMGCIAKPSDIPKTRVVFKGGEEGYPTYRIPSLLSVPAAENNTIPTLLLFAEGRMQKGDHGSVSAYVCDDVKALCVYKSKHKQNTLDYNGTRWAWVFMWCCWTSYVYDYISAGTISWWNEALMEEGLGLHYRWSIQNHQKRVNMLPSATPLLSRLGHSQVMQCKWMCAYLSLHWSDIYLS